MAEDSAYIHEREAVAMAIEYAFKERAASAIADMFATSSKTVLRRLRSLDVRVRSSREQRALDERHGRYCHGEALRSAWQRGHFDTDAYRASRFVGLADRPRSGADNAFHGRHHTRASRAAIATAAKTRCVDGFGAYGPEWTPALRAAVVLRDGGTCQVCGACADLQVHHVNLNKADSRLENLLTLCASCHLAFHGRGAHATAIREAHARMLEADDGARWL